jgi:hypothetical protein
MIELIIEVKESIDCPIDEYFCWKHIRKKNAIDSGEYSCDTDNCPLIGIKQIIVRMKKETPNRGGGEGE